MAWNVGPPRGKGNKGRSRVVIIEGAGLFADPIARLRADQPGEVAGVLAAMQQAQQAGHYLAGYFSYELGYALEPKLLPLLPDPRSLPLIWFGVYDRPRPEA